MNHKIPIVFSTDNNYVMQTGVTILSLLKSANPTTVYDIFVLINDDVTEESKHLLRRQVGCFKNHSIDFINVGNVFENAFEIRNISTASYSRLLIPWLLPQYDKVIYADVDIIFHIDLKEVYNVDMTDKLVAGVRGYGFYFDGKLEKYLRNIGLNAEAYINTGFLVINSKLQREKKLRNRFLEEARKQFIYQDQDIINIVCKNRIAFLCWNYNVNFLFYNFLITNRQILCNILNDPLLISMGNDTEKIVDNCINRINCLIHYVGKKPWNAFTHAWRDWWETYQESIFYDPMSEVKTTYNIFQVQPTWRSIAGQIKRKLFH